MSTPDSVAIIAWADNTWEYVEDYKLSDYAHMSDDTFIMYLPANVDEDKIEAYVNAYNRGARAATGAGPCQWPNGPERSNYDETQTV